MDQSTVGLVVLAVWGIAWWLLARMRIRKGGGRLFSILWTGVVALFIGGMAGVVVGPAAKPEATAVAAETSANASEAKQPAERQPAAPSVPVDDVYTTTASALNRDYDRNEVATDLKIAGRVVEVSGRVQSIDKDFTDDVVLNLAAGNEFLPAGMTMEESETAKAAALSKGDQVTVRCKKMRRIMNTPSGDDCILMGR